MPKIKTVISLQEGLLEQVDSLARELKISRSRSFELAIEEFLQRYQNEQLLRKINEAYSEAPDLAETLYLKKSRRQHRQILEDE